MDKDRRRQSWGMELLAELRKQMPYFTTKEIIYWTEKQDELQKALNKALKQEWERFYQEIWGIKVNFSRLYLPEKPAGFNWLLIKVGGLSAKLIFSNCQKVFRKSSSSSENLNIEPDCPENLTYALWLRNRLEADYENSDKSADSLTVEGIQGITLSERLLLERFYNWRTHKHLDKERLTLCSGSRTLTGRVPYVYCSFNLLTVSSCKPDYTQRSLCARTVSK